MLSTLANVSHYNLTGYEAHACYTIRRNLLKANGLQRSSTAVEEARPSTVVIKMPTSKQNSEAGCHQ